MPFSPCGLVMDFVRSCYATKVRPFNDSSEERTIRWFFAPEGAEWFLAENAFTSLNWNPGEVSDLGEVAGRSRPWSSGANITFAQGVKICGSVDYFAYGCPIATPIPPKILCCGEFGIGGIRLRGVAAAPIGPVLEGKGGVILTGKIPLYTGPASYGTGGTTSTGSDGFFTGVVLEGTGGITLTGDCQLLLGPSEALTVSGRVSLTGNVSLDVSGGVLDMATMWGDEAKVIAGSGLTIGHDANQNYGTYSYQASNAIHDSREWTFVVPSTGTWTMYCLCTTSTDHGILTWELDGSSFGGSNDTYSNPGVYNVIFGIFTGTLSAGVHTLRVKMDSKNPSSTAYSFVCTKIWIQK